MNIAKDGPGSHAFDLAELRHVSAALDEATALLRDAWAEGYGSQEWLDLVSTFLSSLASAQPAVPQQAWHVRGKSVELGPAQPAAPEPSAPYPDTTSARQWMKRADSAEAQLAAVLAIVNGRWSFGQMVLRIRSVLTALSPGARFQALVDKVGDSADDLTVFCTSKPPSPGAGGGK